MISIDLDHRINLLVPILSVGENTVSVKFPFSFDNAMHASKTRNMDAYASAVHQQFH